MADIQSIWHTFTAFLRSIRTHWNGRFSVVLSLLLTIVLIVLWCMWRAA